jgi:drug/metabolite transporter (DMT)-like permease
VVVGLFCALAAALVFGVAVVLQAAGARRTSRTTGLDPGVLVRVLRCPTAVAAVVLLLLGFVLHMVAVKLLPLFLAQTGIAVSLVVSALAAVIMFGERLSRLEWTAVGTVCVGLVLLSASAGGVGDQDVAWLPAALFGGLLAIALLAWPVSHVRTTAGTAVLGMLAGFAYAIVGVTGRLLPGWAPSTLVGSPVTYLLVTSGLLAFLIYTLALQRGVVTAVTTPLVVAQTVTPSMIGLLLLGDGIRSGWGMVAGLGLTLTVAAAIALVRFEGAAGPVRRQGTCEGQEEAVGAE